MTEQTNSTNNLLNTLPVAGLISVSLTLGVALSAIAQDDVRAIGMGGAVVSAGQGVGGALGNPSLLMTSKRNKQRYHWRIGGSGELRDGADLINEASDNENSLTEIEDEIDTLSAQTLSCNPILDPGNTVCLTNTTALGDITRKVLNSFNNISGEPVDGRGGSDIAFAVSHTRFPFMVSIGATVTGTGVANISEADSNYAETLIDALSDNNLTVTDIENTASITLNATNTGVDIDSPDDILDSRASAGGVIRTTLTLGTATTLTVGKRAIDVGVSPRISKLTVGHIERTLQEFDENGFDLEDEIRDDEVSETSFTFDVGASMQPTQNKALRIGGVIRNVVPESITTNSGFEFESTAQLIVSGTYQFSRILATADLALNEAKYDNFETQPLSIGAEFDVNWFSARAGLQNDFASSSDSTTFSLGVGLGPVDLGMRINGNNVSGGMQIAFSL